MFTPLEVLFRTGVNLKLFKEEIVSSLVLSHPDEQLKVIKMKLFDIAKSVVFAHPKDFLVRMLKQMVGHLVLVKHANDIAELCYAVKHQQLSPRTILTNGKCSAASITSSRLEQSASTSVISDPGRGE